MPQKNDLSRSLVALDQDSTISAVFGHAAGAKSFGRRAKTCSYLRSRRYGAIGCP
jgi:hypothetical protein